MKLQAEWKMALCGRSQDVLSFDSIVMSHFDYLYYIYGICCLFSEGYLLKMI